MNSHSRGKRYHEYLAKLILEELFPEIYLNLVMDESPDLRNDIGNNIEVTKATYSGDEEASSLFTRIMGRPLEEIDARIKERFQQLGHELYEFNGRVQAHSFREAVWETTNEIERAVENKLKKVDQYIGEVDLFIYAPTFDSYNEGMIQEFTELISEKCAALKKCFRVIYIFDYTSIYVCNIEDMTSQRLIIESTLIKKLVEKAREFAEAI